ncbi:MAG: hypothetical protein ABF335_02650 [Alphaproteobacteria bacterium]
MSFEQTHMAFLASDAQHDLSNRFIAQMRGDNPRKAPDMIKALLSNILNDTLDYYILQPAEILEIKGGLLRVIKVGAAMITKATLFFVKRVAGGLSIEQSIAGADYIENTRVLSEDENGKEISYIAFPILDRTAEELRTVIARIKDGHYGRTEKAQLTGVMIQLMEAGVDIYLRDPVKQMQFTGLTAKLAKNTEQTVVKALDRLISDMFPKLTHDQAIRYAAYLEDTILMVEVEEVDDETGAQTA